MGNSRESPSRSKNDSSLRMKFWKRSSPILSPLVASRLLVFTEIAGCDRAGERGTGMEQVKPQSSPFLLRFTHFSSKSTYWIAARLVNFQSSAKVYPDDFLLVFSLFLWKGKFFRGSYSVIFSDVFQVNICLKQHLADRAIFVFAITISVAAVNNNWKNMYELYSSLQKRIIPQSTRVGGEAKRCCLAEKGLGRRHEHVSEACWGKTVFVSTGGMIHSGPKQENTEIDFAQAQD